MKRKDTGCSRCGRTSHTSDTCYASTHLDGRRPVDLRSQRRSPPAEGGVSGASGGGGTAARCSRCGHNSHEAADCFAATRVDGSPVRAAPVSASARARGSEPTCLRCGRMGHTREMCFASIDRDGQPIRHREPPRAVGGVGAARCSRCGHVSHVAEDCFAATRVDGSPVREALVPARGAGVSPRVSECSRCGRLSHTVETCFASTHADGRIIGASRSPSAPCEFCRGMGHAIQACPRRAPYDPMIAQAPPPRNRRIANMMGSSYDRPWSSSHLADAEAHLGPQSQCVVLDCQNPAEEGAHVWVEGERDFFFIAPLCRQCNHRHGDEEICWCRYIANGLQPRRWIPIKDTWLCKIASPGGTSHFLPFREWCESADATHRAGRERCSRYCSATAQRT